MKWDRPLLEVEAGLTRLGIAWQPVDDRQGVWVADRCPGCLREDSKPDGLRISWIGERQALVCEDLGCDQEKVERGLGMAPLPPPPKSAEHTEHSDENPDGERDRGVRLGGEHPAEHEANADPPGLAYEPRILDHFDEAMGALGLVGERPLARTVKLVALSRLLRTPARLVVKGDSSSGKSFAVDSALKTSAPEGLYVRTGTSAKAMFFSDEDFRHRAIVFFEANRLGDDDDELARVLRTLISEGKLAHEVTVIEKRTTALLEKEGPVAFISTTCKATLDKEIETRILSLNSDNSDGQTSAVVASVLRAAAGEPADVDLSEWHQLDRWLAAGDCDVVVPWATGLAEAGLSGPPRLRRDVTNLLALAEAHTLLHRASREIDDRGRIISTLDDYQVVAELLSDALAVATDKAVRPGTRAVVDAVAELRAKDARTSLRAVSAQAGRSSSTTHHDVHEALDRGYLINRSQNSDRFDLDIGDPLRARKTCCRAGRSWRS